MNNNHSMMNDELFRLFESKLKNLGISNETEPSNATAIQQSTVGQALETDAETSPSHSLSFAEERAWMLHQQDPLASSGPFLSGIKLTGQVQIDQLLQAIEQLYQNDSNLNLRYALDQEGLLAKFYSNQAVQPTVHAVQSEQHAVEYLLQQIQIPMDLSQDAPIRFVVMPQNDQEVYLGILGHHILIDDTAWQPIFKFLNHFYHAKKVPEAAVDQFQTQFAEHHVAVEYWLTQFPTGLTTLNIPKFFQRNLDRPIRVLEVGKKAQSETANKAIRTKTQVSAQALQQLGEHAQSSIFHSMVTAFGVFLAQTLSEKHIDIFVPVVSAQQINHLSQIQSSSNVLPIRINGALTDLVEETILVRNQILNGMAHQLAIEQILSVTKTPRTTIPNVLVTQFADAAQYLQLAHVDAESFDIPPIHSDYDIILAFQFKKGQSLELELTTGNKLSTSVGALLLEQFAYFLETDQLYSKVWQAVSKAEGLFSPTEVEIKGAVPADVAQLNVSSQVQNSSSEAISNLKLTHQNHANLSHIVEIILNEFKAVLLNEDLSAEDNFFDLGGHSILATRVIGKLQSQHQLSVGIADFFSAPTALELAQYVQSTESVSIEAKNNQPNDDIVAPLTLLQKAFMGFSDQGRDAMYNIPFAFKLSEALDEEVFELAFKDLMQRHHALRSIFIRTDEQQYMQMVVPMDQLSNHPWFWSSEAQVGESATEILHQEANHCFELTKQFPLRVRFLKDEAGQSILSLLLYHIAMDEWSSGILIRELIQAYVSRVAGHEPRWESTPRQFHEYALAQNDAQLQQHLQYWIDKIGRVQKPAPLLSQAGDASRYSEDVKGSAVEFILNARETEQLYAVSRQCKSSIFYVAYASIVLAMHYLGAGKKLLTGTSVACRHDPLYQDTMGYFTNVVMHNTHFHEEMKFAELVQQVQGNILESMNYADIPFAIVEDNIRAEDETSTESPYEIYIQLHAKNALTGQFQLENGHEIGFELIEPERNTAKFGLHFEIYEEPLSESERFRVVINYRTQRYNPTQISLIRSVTEQVMRQLIQADLTQLPNVMELRRQLATRKFETEVV